MNIEGGSLATQEQICEQIRKAGGEVFFSVSDDKITGYYAYIVVKDEELQCNIVNDIKMFSFDENRSDTTLVKDLKSLIDILLKEYPVIQWTALKDNPANRIYQRAIKEYGGYCYDDDEENSDLVVYEIESEKYNENQNFLTI